MKKTVFSLILLFFVVVSHSQTLSISGTVQDTSAKAPLQNALSMAIRLNDSTLIQFSRTDKNGLFKLEAIPIDTYIVVVSHPQFADQTFIVVGSERQKILDFGKIILPPKTNMLNEVVVYGYADKMYYKGDTLMFTADSFKTRANATVEDLLRKLPGVKVDAAGKITVQGKEVSQVLVDGDEFFGTDPTIATRNLGANTVESVQVYEKKNDNTDSKDETVSVMNLKLKEDAKKGYFGKISGAGGIGGDKTFYEGELLANRFNKNRKASVFALGANSPRQRFNWDDIWQYGLDNEANFETNEDGGRTMWTNNEETSGIPTTLKTGFYFSDKVFKKTKLNLDYSFNQNELNTETSTNTQYFLEDTTYSNAQTDVARKTGLSHNINFKVTQTLDSLTELIIAPKLKYVETGNNATQVNDFISETDSLTRRTTINSRNNGVSYDATVNAKINRKFKKKDRYLVLNYNFNTKADNFTSYLLSQNDFYGSGIPNSTVNQQKTLANDRQEHQAGIIYTEPLSKKIKLEFSYDILINQSFQDKRTKDFSGAAYDIENIALTNNFNNSRMVNRAGTKFIYEVKKYKFSLGTRVRQVDLVSNNLSTGIKLSQTVYNVLPVGSFRYSFTQNSRLNIEYTSNSQQPELTQLQPVVDNSNPNRITLGNPALKPSFGNNINVNGYSYKPITGRNFYVGGYYNNTYNAITYITNYDSNGVATSSPININGNYNLGSWLGMGIPLFKKLVSISPGFNTGFYSNRTYINNAENITTELSLTPRIEIELEAEKLSFTIGGNYDYNKPSSTISNRSNQPYATYQLSGDIQYKLPKKFIISTDAEYTDNSQRTDGYNISYVIWNATFSKMFLKNDNLIVSFNAYDILNQNISTKRTIQDNRIVDFKGQVIKQYFLLKVLFKFNSNKEKEEDDDF